MGRPRLTASIPGISALLLLGAAHAACGKPKTALAARDIVARIEVRAGTSESLWWRLTQKIDTFKAGNPDTRVTGIATTTFATMEVLREAADRGSNLIITHEPTFWDHLEDVSRLEAAHDPVLAEKRAFIEQHGLVIWRFHELWHGVRPDGIIEGAVQKLGWKPFQQKEDAVLFVLPETTLEQLAVEVRRLLDAPMLRVVGDPQMRVTRVGLLPGAPSARQQIRVLSGANVQVLVTGEAREWETVEYARDAAASGRAKALIVIGHIRSEQPGMEECARWLRAFITEVPVVFIPTSEALWAPDKSAEGTLPR